MLGDVIAFVDENGTAKLHDDSAILFEAGSFDGDDAHVGSGFGFAFGEDFGLGVEGVAFEYGSRNSDLLPTEIDTKSGYISR